MTTIARTTTYPVIFKAIGMPDLGPLGTQVTGVLHVVSATKALPSFFFAETNDNKFTRSGSLNGRLVLARDVTEGPGTDGFNVCIADDCGSLIKLQVIENNGTMDKSNSLLHLLADNGANVRRLDFFRMADLSNQVTNTHASHGSVYLYEDGAPDLVRIRFECPLGSLVEDKPPNFFKSIVVGKPKPDPRFVDREIFKVFLINRNPYGVRVYGMFQIQGGADERAAFLRVLERTDVNIQHRG